MARTIAILGQEPVLLIVPANGTVVKVADFKGKAIGVVKGGGLNGAILDTILKYYEVPEPGRPTCGFECARSRRRGQEKARGSFLVNNPTDSRGYEVRFC
jgi:hypothetical protein